MLEEVPEAPPRERIEGIKRLAPRIMFFVQFDHPRYPKHHLAANLFARELLSDPWIVNAPIFDPVPGGGGGLREPPLTRGGERGVPTMAVMSPKPYVAYALGSCG